MKPSSKHRRLAGILAVAALTPACTASPPARHAHHHALELACTTLPIASASAAGTSGQRSPLDMPPVPGGLGGIAARSSGSAYAVGSISPDANDTRALVALWNGAVWRTLSSRALPRESDLSAVALFPGGAWAVGEYGMAEHGRVFRPLLVRVTGTTVRQVPVPGPRSYSSSLDDVTATSAADAWAVGFTYTIPLILHWNGTAWTRPRLPATVGRGLFTGVAATSRTNAWAVMAPRTGRARIVHWNGRLWGDVVSPAIGMSYRLFGVAATSAKNAWAVGSTGSSRAVILHWDGLRWTCALSRKMHRDYPTRTLDAVSASSADNAWAVGSSFDSAHRALALHWDGHTWKQVMTPHPVDNFLHGVAVIPQSGSAWAVGAPPADVRPQKAIVAHWDGAAWTTFSPRGLPRLSALGAVATFPGGAWAVGDHGLTQHGDGGGRPKQLIVRLTGTTMRRVPVPGPADGGLVDVAATSAANAWAVGYIGGVSGGPPLILHWNGTAWTRAPLPAALGRGYFAGVAATSRTNAWAVMNPDKQPGMARILHWNGKRWGDVDSPAIGVSCRLYDVAATSAKNVWAVGSAGSTRTVILHWNGLRWTWALSPKIHRGHSFRALFAVSASSADNALAVGSSGTGTLAQHWNGHGWKRFKTPRRGGYNSLEDVTFIPRSGRAWAVDDTGSATLIFQWDGTAWH